MTKKHNTSANQGRSDQDILNLFIEKYRGLAETSLGQTGFSVNHQITYDQVGITTVLDQPDEDAIRSFLLTFRQFVSEKEPLFLGRVYGVCYRHLEQDVLRDRIKQMREIWASVQQVRGVSMNFYGVELSGSKIFDVWANGWYFHSDADYTQLLEQLPPIAWDMLRAHFINFIIEVMRLVHDLCKVILNGFGEDPARLGFILLHPA
ncbi:MAG TPA: hypothetical protein VEP90_19290 [Methylomirabilota bacterium]|nr:hypothetical protein [Methylomirabilota bacterium]